MRYEIWHSKKLAPSGENVIQIKGVQLPISQFYHNALLSSTIVSQQVIFFKVVVLAPWESLSVSSALLAQRWPLEPVADR